MPAFDLNAPVGSAENPGLDLPDDPGGAQFVADHSIMPVPQGGLPSAGEIIDMLRSNLGVRITIKAIAALVRELGFGGASDALKIPPPLLGVVYVASKTRRRRARGITGRQLSNAKRTIRQMASFNRQLQNCMPRHHGGGHTRPPWRKGKK